MKNHIFSKVLLGMTVTATFLCSLQASALAKVEVFDTEFSGTVNQTGSYSELSGNRVFSFVDPFAHYDTDVVASAKRYLPNKWEWNTDVRVRKTDDSEVDSRKSVHLLQLTTALKTKETNFTFGDYYTRFTDITLDRALRGFNYTTDWKQAGTKLNLVAARSQPGLDNVQYSRYVWGYHFDQDVFTKKTFGIVNRAWIGQSLVDNFDRSASIERTSGVPRLSNFLGSLNGGVNLFDGLNITSEFAKSSLRDRSNVLLGGGIYGYAFSLHSNYRKNTKFGTTGLYFDYERVQPNFASLNGSVPLDREAYYANWMQRFNKNFTLNTSFRTLRNNLDDLLPGTVKTWNPRVSLNITPFEKVPDFIVTPYWDYRRQNSSNNSVDNTTSLAGVEAEKKVWYGLILTGAYDLRDRHDGVGTTDELANDWRIGARYDWQYETIHITPNFQYRYRSDYFNDIPNRTSFRDFQWGITSEFFNRARVNFNYGMSFDDRSFVNTDTDLYQWTIQGEYDLLANLMLVISWRQYNQKFQVRASDFEENVGSIRLQYKY